MNKHLIERKERGLLIAQANGLAKRKTERVSSQSGNGSYHVVFTTEFGWTCSCQDFTYRGGKCKHIHGVEFNFVVASL
jgi:hypothetical protein